MKLPGGPVITIEEIEHNRRLNKMLELSAKLADLLLRLDEVISDAEYDNDPNFGKQARALNAERLQLLAEWESINPPEAPPESTPQTPRS